MKMLVAKFRGCNKTTQPVGIAFRLRIGRSKNRGSIPASFKTYFLLPIVQTGSGSHVASCVWRKGLSSRGV